LRGTATTAVGAKPSSTTSLGDDAHWPIGDVLAYFASGNGSARGLVVTQILRTLVLLLGVLLLDGLPVASEIQQFAAATLVVAIYLWEA
jgi:hypothetical protein